MATLPFIADKVLMRDLAKPASNRRPTRGRRTTGELLQPIAVRIPEACRISGIGRSKIYQLIGAGEIPVIKVGAIALISVDSLQRFLLEGQREVGQVNRF